MRTKRGVTPTEAGKVLYSHARAILQQCELAQRAVGNLGQIVSGQVSIGLAPGTSSSPLIRPLLQAVRDQYPQMTVYLHENSSAALNEKVSRGQLDMAVHYDPAVFSGVNSVPLLKEDLFLVGTHDNPGGSIELSDVAIRELFLPRDFSAIRKRVDEAFSLRRLSAKIIGEIDSIATLTAAAASGMGNAVLPESTAATVVSTTNAWMARIIKPRHAVAADAHHVVPFAAFSRRLGGENPHDDYGCAAGVGETGATAGQLNIILTRVMCRKKKASWRKLFFIV